MQLTMKVVTKRSTLPGVREGAVLLFSSLLAVALATTYEPDWSSLDSRPLPAWYDEAKFGIFLHWGVYSVIGYSTEWFWYYWKTEYNINITRFMKNYPQHFTYQDFARDFRPIFFEPDDWADLIEASGAKYVVLTSKHHEGYTMWPSNLSWSWNAMDVGPNMDLVGALANSIRSRTSVRFGLYYSLYEWFNPVYLQDKANDFHTQTYSKRKAIPELKDLINTYQPEVVWSDGDWEANCSYWDSQDFLAWLYSESPVRDSVVTNDRWGNDSWCLHGDFFDCKDRYNPGVLQEHKWENCMTIDKLSWGYRRNANIEDFLSIEEIVGSLITTISCGGNLLLNVGPDADGVISPIFAERLMQMGQWLSVNGEAVYASSPWTYQNDTLTPNVWYTTNRSSKAVYAFVLDFPEHYLLTLEAPATNAQTKVSLLGAGPIAWEGTGDRGLTVTFPCVLPASLQWAWVIKLENLQ